MFKNKRLHYSLTSKIIFVFYITTYLICVVSFARPVDKTSVTMLICYNIKSTYIDIIRYKFT